MTPDYSLNNAALKQWKADGKKVFGTICCHLPEELIYAAGILPIRIRATGGKDDSVGEIYMSPFSCSYARTCLQQLTDGTYAVLDGLIGNNGCMQAQRIYDNAAAIDTEKKIDYYLYTTPRLIHDKALDFYKNEAGMLKEWLEGITGEKITDEKLRAAVEVYNESRRLIRQLYELRKAEHPVISGTDTLKWTLAAMTMPKEDFNAQLKEFLAHAGELKPIEGHDVRLMFIGSGMDDPEYMKIIEDKGCLVVTDVQCFGSRYLWEEIDTEGDIWENMCEMYLRRPRCPRFSDIHTKLTEFMVEMAKEYRAQGIFYSRLKNCDPWGGEILFFSDAFKEANLPFLEMEREEITYNAGQLSVRTEAFIEMLEGM